jgi:hypothetical protein
MRDEIGVLSEVGIYLIIKTECFRFEDVDEYRFFMKNLIINNFQSLLSRQFFQELLVFDFIILSNSDEFFVMQEFKGKFHL